MRIIPDRVRHARKRVGLSQEELAETLGCGRRSVAGWELGETQPVPRLLRQLALVTGTPIPWLLGEEQDGVGSQDP